MFPDHPGEGIPDGPLQKPDEVLIASPIDSENGVPGDQIARPGAEGGSEAAYRVVRGYDDAGSVRHGVYTALIRANVIALD